MARCEDYPCCGHTDGLGCNYVPDTEALWQHAATHASCEHEHGWCVLDDEDEDE